MNILVFLILFIVPNILHSQWIQQRNYIPKMNTGRTIDASDKNSAAFYSTLIFIFLTDALKDFCSTRGGIYDRKRTFCLI